MSGTAIPCAAIPGARATAATASARHANNRIAHWLHPVLSQALGGVFVLVDQQFAQQIAHVLHPQLADFGRHPRFTHHLLQSPDITLGAQRVAFGLNAAQTLGGTDQGVELSQHGIGSVQSGLLRFGELDLRKHFALIQERKLTKVHARVFCDTAFRWGRPLGKNLQQGHRIALDQSRLVLVQQAQAVTDQIALLNVAAARLITGQRPLRDFDQFPHEHLAPTHGVDDTGTENGSRTRRGLGHGGEESSRFPVAILLELARHLSAL